MKPSPSSNDLTWLAYQYVTGELSLRELESFERRLSDDQDAREAVADAVELHDGLVAAGAGLLAPRVPAMAMWKRVAGVVATIAAVAVGIVFAQPEAVAPSKQRDSQAARPIASVDRLPQTAQSRDKDDQHLAELWATQWGAEGRELAAAEQWREGEWQEPSTEPEQGITWDGAFGTEEPAAWMWEALDATDSGAATSMDGELDMPEEESL